MKFNFSSSQFMIIAFVAIMGYLYITDSLSGELFFLFAILIILSLLYSTREKRVISLKEARLIAEKYVLELQEKGEMPDGTVKVSEGELKDIILKTAKFPMVEPDRYLIKVSIEPMYAYLVKISIFGTVLGYSEIKIPATFTVASVPDREVKAGLSRIDNLRKRDEDDEHEES